MPIEKGKEWGTSGVLPADAPVVGSDAAAAALIESTHEIIGLNGGDLARTLGVRAEFERQGIKHLVPVDQVIVRLDDGSTHRCLAHTVLGRPWLSAESVAVMNAAFLGSRNIAPRAHPGDGKADIVTLKLNAIDRLKAWRRMPTASHMPHPGIATQRRSSGSVVVPRPTPVWVDGNRVGRTRELSYEVRPNAILIAVS